MIPIHWREFTARVRGSVWKSVSCTHCSCEYLYLYEAWATGSGSSLYGLDNDGAQRRASERAEQALTRHLETAIHPVPCPDCGTYQPDMVVLMRRRYHRWLSKLGWVLVAVAALGAFPALMYTFLGENSPDRPTILATVWGAVAAVGGLGLACLLIRRAAQSGYDPNFSDVDERLRLGQEMAVRRADLPPEPPDVPTIPMV